MTTSDLEMPSLLERYRKVVALAIAHYQELKQVKAENIRLKQEKQQLKADNSKLVERCQKLAEAYINLKHPQLFEPISLEKLLNSKGTP